jgi:hypothetical protein
VVVAGAMPDKEKPGVFKNAGSKEKEKALPT